MINMLFLKVYIITNRYTNTHAKTNNNTINKQHPQNTTQTTQHTTTHITIRLLNHVNLKSMGLYDKHISEVLKVAQHAIRRFMDHMSHKINPPRNKYKQRRKQQTQKQTTHKHTIKQQGKNNTPQYKQHQ